MEPDELPDEPIQIAASQLYLETLIAAGLYLIFLPLELGFRALHKGYDSLVEWVEEED